MHVSVMVNSDDRFDVDVEVGGIASIKTENVSLLLHSRCQLERLAVAIDEALHREAVVEEGGAE